MLNQFIKNTEQIIWNIIVKIVFCYLINDQVVHNITYSVSKIS